MREVALLVSNYALFALIISALAGLQSSLWLHVFGFSPAPYLWLTAINYWVLYRTPVEAAMIIYLATYILVTMSGVPMEMAFAVHISLFATIYFLRDRVLWSGPNSFMLSCGISAFFLPIYTWLWSHALESRPLSDFHFFEWIMRSLLTGALSLPLYYLFVFADKITRKNPPKDAESGVI